jgi:L-threonylcarbamoyladenylate synthase
VLRAGGIVAFPTDTLYGLAVDPRRDDAVERLFALKGRRADAAVPLVAGDNEQAAAAGELGPGEMRLAAAFWPGPLSLVVPARGQISRAVLAADGTVAIRVPAHAVARALALAFGFCITATSANASGHAPAASADAVAGTLLNLDLLLDGGSAPGGLPSTIVSLQGSAPTLVRAGAIAWERVLKSLQ